MMASTRSAGVTSKAGLCTAAPTGVIALARALLDLDGGSVAGVRVDRRQRGGDVERNAVVAGRHRQPVGADLVGDVAVGGDPVGAHDGGPDPASTQDGGRCAVGDHRAGDPVPSQFEGGETGPLEHRPGLVGPDVEVRVVEVRRADHAERRAVADRG